MERYELDELHFYCVEAELQGIAWFSTLVHPNVSLRLFTQSTIPIIHNYPLLLALVGWITEESYITKYNELKKVDPPAKRFGESGVYAYPLQLTRVYHRNILMSMAETDYVFYKPLTRAAIPLLTKHTVMTPGTKGKTIVVSREELPKELYVRLGVKRFGVWRLELEKTTPILVNNKVIRLTSPFNTLDTDSRDYVDNPLVVIKHYAGDIAISGAVKKAIKLTCNGETFLKPVPFFIT